MIFFPHKEVQPILRKQLKESIASSLFIMDIKIIFAMSIPTSSKTETDWFVQSAGDLGSVKVAHWESRSLSKH